jgi:putative glutamine amidotransferase
VAKKPHILIPANVIDYNGGPGHIARETYVRALLEIADCIPLILPAIGNVDGIEDTLSRIDGIVLSGIAIAHRPRLLWRAADFRR